MIETRELKPNLWPDLADLFGPNGADDGCWCMSWRSEKEVRGDEARDKFQELVERGQAHGILAYANGKPAGWCAFGPRESFYHASKMLEAEDGPETGAWAIPCFFVSPSFRGQGLAKILLRAATEAIRRKGGKRIEGYPVSPDTRDETQRKDWAFTGPFKIFEEEGFIPGERKWNGCLVCVRRQEA